MASTFAKIAGIIGSRFQVGIGATAVAIKEFAGKLQVRNKADTGLAGLAVSTLDLTDSAGVRKTTIVMPTGAAVDLTLTLPTTAGTAGYALTTNGAGLTTWTAAGNTAMAANVDTTDLLFGSATPVAMFPLPPSAVVLDVQVIVDTAFNGAPTMSVGVTGSLSKYVGTGDVDLTQANVYDVGPSGLPANPSAEAPIVTYSAGGATAGAARVLVTFSIPS